MEYLGAVISMFPLPLEHAAENHLWASCELGKQKALSYSSSDTNTVGLSSL